MEESLNFQYQKATPELGDDYLDYLRNTILKGMTEDNILQITGQYYEGEVAPEGQETM